MWFEKENATEYEKLYLLAADGMPQVTNGCAAPTKRELATNDVNIKTAAFDPTSDEYMQWTQPLPDEWDEGEVDVRFVWTHQGAAGNTVRWAIRATSFGDDETIDAAWTIGGQFVDDAALGANDWHESGVAPGLNISGSPSAGDGIQWRVQREASDANDDFASDAELIMIIIEYGVKED